MRRLWRRRATGLPRMKSNDAGAPATGDRPMNAPTAVHFDPEHAQRPVPAAMLEALRERFGERCSTAAAVREQHGRDESPFEVTPPAAVVFAESTEDAAFLVALAAQHRV